MKRHLTLMLTFIWTLHYGQTKSLKTAQEDIISALSAAIADDKELYLKNVYSKQAFAYRMTKDTPLSKDEQKRTEELINISYDKYLEEQEKRFSSIKQKVKELEINWQQIKVDSITIKANGDKLNETNSGTIYFRTANNSQFYRMNYQGLLMLGNRHFIETLFVPYLYVGPKNRLLAANLKKQFIDTCLMNINLQISINDALKSVYGKCPPCICESLYVSETEQDDGVQRIEKYIKAEVPRLRTKKK